MSHNDYARAYFCTTADLIAHDVEGSLLATQDRSIIAAVKRAKYMLETRLPSIFHGRLSPTVERRAVKEVTRELKRLLSLHREQQTGGFVAMGDLLG